MSKRQISTLEWFGNDADGLTVIDLISAIMFLYFLVVKSIQLSLTIRYSGDPAVLLGWNESMYEINNFTELMMMFYFGKKVIDTAVTKVGLFKSGKYDERNTIEIPSDPISAIPETTFKPMPNLDEECEEMSDPPIDLILDPEIDQATVSPAMLFGARKSDILVESEEIAPINNIIEEQIPNNIIRISLQK